MIQSDIVKQLTERGLTLNSGSSIRSSEDLRKNTGLTMSDRIFVYYRLFDGFYDQDTNTYIQIWPLSRVIKTINSELSKDMPEKYVAIGDFLMDSDFLICDLERPEKPVKLLYEGRNIGASYQDFWRIFIDGGLDR